MNRFISLIFALAAVIAPPSLRAQVALPTAAPAAPIVVPVTPAPDPNALKWDAETKEYNAKPGEANAPFTFTVTNVSQTTVAITSLRTSCGCTVAQLPTTPYNLEPGSNVLINVSMNLAGKSGSVTKTVNVDSSVGSKVLLVRVNVPAPEPVPAAGEAHRGDRAKNMMTAAADRQAVFKGDCAKCHVDKSVGKLGVELYNESCGICHDSPNRAAMVPDLKVPRSIRDLAFWQKWIVEGKAGTMMPAFGAALGGPLTQEQIDSLAAYLYQNYPKVPTIPNPVVVPLNPAPAPIPIPIPVPAK